MMQKSIEWFHCESCASQERIVFVSQTIGVSFPKSFVVLMQECDGGTPEITCFEYTSQSMASEIGTGLGSFLGFEETPDHYDLLGYYLDPSEFFPSGLVAFADTGGGDYICFDYRQDKSNPDPEIVYWEHGSEEGNDICFVAKNFDAFMAMLHPFDESLLD